MPTVDPKTQGPKPDYDQSYQPNPQLLPYAAMKAAIASMTKTLSKLAMQRSVRVNAVAPVYVFLASNESRFVTGEIYGITGGRTPY